MTTRDPIHQLGRRAEGCAVRSAVLVIGRSRRTASLSGFFDLSYEPAPIGASSPVDTMLRPIRRRETRDPGVVGGLFQIYGLYFCASSRLWD
jgi:hypothetical protein